MYVFVLVFDGKSHLNRALPNSRGAIGVDILVGDFTHGVAVRSATDASGSEGPLATLDDPGGDLCFCRSGMSSRD